MMKNFFFLACTLAVVFFSQLISAEEIKIPVGSQTPELNNIQRPTTGMTKSQVNTQFGAPIKENAAKGKPPISSWEYANFTVYFENEHVIHSVIKPTYHESTTTIIEETIEMKEDDLK